MFDRVFLLLAFTLAVTPLCAEMLHVPADRDATLIQDPSGGRANGSGPAVFAGRTGQGEYGLRRGLIRFDVAAVLPERAIIDRVFVSLYQTSTSNTAPNTVSVHIQISVPDRPGCRRAIR